MAKDPAFLFYPGDYLRDTQCLSEPAQVAYDRIMCEHMRNICTDMNNIIVSQEKVNFFIKRLNSEHKEEIFHVLTKVDGGFQIYWVAESIANRKSYSDSRSKNRSGHMKTYDSHMEDENENKDEKKNTDNKMLVPEMFTIFKKILPQYPTYADKDFKPLLSIATFIKEQIGVNGTVVTNQSLIVEEWKKICPIISEDNFYKQKPLTTISNQIQEIYQIYKNGRPANSKKQSVAGQHQAGIDAAIKRGQEKFAALREKNGGT